MWTHLGPSGTPLMLLGGPIGALMGPFRGSLGQLGPFEASIGAPLEAPSHWGPVGHLGDPIKAPRGAPSGPLGKSLGKQRKVRFVSIEKEKKA
jgi:hypothetical protein